jgi:protein-L-isoaspartate(D-aspartate) O-methyltransferase
MRMDYAAARRNMVESQLRPNKVTDPVLLAALAAVPRELFVPEPLRGVAYVDEDIPLGRGRFLMEPMILGRLLELGAVRPADVALVVGAGLGYAAAVLARVAGRVVALESDHDFAQQAAQTLQSLGIANMAVVEGPLAEGAPRQAPFDVVLFDGAIDRVPAVILDQLAEGGRLATVIRTAGIGRATLMTRQAGILASRVAFDAAVPRLPGFEPAPAFVF